MTAPSIRRLMMAFRAGHLSASDRHGVSAPNPLATLEAWASHDSSQLILVDFAQRFHCGVDGCRM
jgi:hypothetical protein